MYQYNIENEIEFPGGNKLKYVFKDYHRQRGHKEKSWWVQAVGFEEELECFKFAHTNYLDGGNCFGYIKEPDGLLQLGMNILEPVLKIAKFVNSGSTVWIGYPADYRHKKDDIPPKSTLGKWVVEEVINESQMSRIMRKQRCSL